MILSMSNQALLFLSTFLTGFLIGFVYDWLRVLRTIFRHPNFLIHIEDAVFWIAATVFIFVFMLNKNYGEIRLFSVCGVFIGMLIYFLTLSRLFLKLSDVVIKCIKTLFEIIMTPIRLIFKILEYPCRFLKKSAIKQYRINKKLLKRYQIYAKMGRKRIRKNFKIILKKV